MRWASTLRNRGGRTSAPTTAIPGRSVESHLEWTPEASLPDDWPTWPRG